MVDKSYARRLALNSAIFKMLYWVLAVDDVGHENYVPVGRGVKSSSLCGKHVGFSVCRNKEGHLGGLLNGVVTSNKIIVRHRHLWCHRSLCPVCFIRGWSVRGARSIEGRLAKAVELGLGKIEHVMVSIAIADRVFSEDILRKLARKALFDRGVLGGCMIFHAYRIDKKRKVLVWSPHYHVLGFILGGFDRCRTCVHVRGDCASCSGFKGKEVRGYAKDKMIVKVFEERAKSRYGDKPNTFGSAFYQLNHASVRIGIKRFHAVTWFGVCGNRKFKSKEVMSVVTCPVCKDEMIPSVFVGKRYIEKRVGHPDYVAVFVFDEFDEFGAPNFIDKE